MASSSRPGAPTLQTGMATRPAPILRATSAPTGTPPLGSATTTGRTRCSPRATCSPSTLPASARSANRPSNKASLAPGLLVRLVGVHHHPAVVVGVVADRDRPPDFHPRPLFGRGERHSGGHLERLSLARLDLEASSRLRVTGPRVRSSTTDMTSACAWVLRGLRSPKDWSCSAVGCGSLAGCGGGGPA